ncbi:CoA transferase [Paraburkholderia sp. MM5482-R1]|uniref:CoA transferase n=1 Tax=Paraburkholderia sp. MM5482-R1 TaxID=2991063 RepID=UPI003D205F74
MAGPLQGLKVVDLSRVLAGPLCARTLADLGAEVIKVEPPRPDVSRFAFPNTDGMSGYYAQQNVGKRNVSIDLNVAGARELVLKLCKDADIFVENFRAGTLKFFGLDYEELSKINPRLIYVCRSRAMAKGGLGLRAWPTHPRFRRRSGSLTTRCVITVTRFPS